MINGYKIEFKAPADQDLDCLRNIYLHSRTYKQLVG